MKVANTNSVTRISKIVRALTATEKPKDQFLPIQDEIILTTPKQRAREFIDGRIHVGCLLERQIALEGVGVEYITTGIGHIQIADASSQHIQAEYNHQLKVQQAILGHST